MLTEREKIFLTHWEKKRAIGKWKFSFIHGTVLWGIPVYACLQLYYFFFREGYVFDAGRFFSGLLAWLLIGFFGFGLLMWWLNERAYHKINMKNPEA